MGDMPCSSIDSVKNYLTKALHGELIRWKDQTVRA